MRTPRQSTFTLAEIMVASSIMVIMLAATLPFAMGIMRTYMIARIHDEIQMKANTIGDYLKRDLLCTSKHEVMFVPTDGTSFRAISFPVLRRPLTDDSAPLNQTTGDVQWTEWVIWHIYGTNPAQMRRTVVKPFPATMTWDARKAATMSILTNGSAAGIAGLTSTNTRVMAKQVDAYGFGLRESDTDAYASSVVNDSTALGIMVLSPGDHVYKWKITTKNTASSNYHLDIDTITTGSTGLPIDMEYYLPINSYSGPQPVFENMSTYPGWSNNAQLTFPASSADQYFTCTIYNDTWLASNFNSSGVTMHGTKVCALQDSTSDMVVQLLGNGTGWDAATQTGGGIQSGAGDYSDATVRTLIAGADPILCGSIGYGGRQCRVTFSADPTYGLLYIESAYIMERNGTTGFNGKSGTLNQIFFHYGVDGYNYAIINGGQSCYLGTNGHLTSNLVDLNIDKTKDYIVSFHIGNTAEWYGGQVSAWVPPADIPQATANHSTILYGDFGGPNTDNLDWSALAPTNVSKILGVTKLFVTFPDTATYISQIVDTRVDDPAYNKMTFHADTPQNSTVTIQVRSGDDPYLVDAPDWASVTGYSQSNQDNSISNIGQGRYVQYQATLTTPHPYTTTPSLRDVCITWPGQNRAVELSANLAKGPDCGKFQLLIDDRTPAFAGVQVLTLVGRKFLGKSYQSKSMVDIDPRNP